MNTDICCEMQMVTLSVEHAVHDAVPRDQPLQDTTCKPIGWQLRLLKVTYKLLAKCRCYCLAVLPSNIRRLLQTEHCTGIHSS
jgi:hypothetical protein